MAISKAVKAALKVLSYPDPDVRKTYLIERKLKKLNKMHPKDPRYRTWDHEVSCGDHKVPVRIFSLPDGLNHPVLLFFHGGGWVTGDIDSYDRVCMDMARMTQRVVVSVDYRLAPEHRFPAAVEDCYAVAREVFLNTDLLGVKPEEITLIGDSAGGNLAAAVSLMARDRGEFLPGSQILLYPATYSDHTPSSPYASVVENGSDYLLTSKRICEFMELYISSPNDYENPYFAPLLAKDFSNQPRTFIITAEFCPLRDEGEAYGQKLREAGGDVEIYCMPDALHGYFSLPTSFALVKRSYILINRFLKGPGKK